MSHCAGPFVILIYYCEFLTLSAQKATSSSSVKTILDKTFAGSAVNACFVESER